MYVVDDTDLLKVFNWKYCLFGRDRREIGYIRGMGVFFKYGGR